MPGGFHAITTKSNGILRAIQSEVTVITVDGKHYKGQAIWDTGATGTCISERAAKVLDLKPIGFTVVNTASGQKNTSQFLVDLVFPNGVRIKDIRATEFSGTSDIDFLIGMDVICVGDFSITNANRSTVFSYRTPSDWWHIDYVAVAKSTKSGKTIKRELKKIQF